MAQQGQRSLVLHVALPSRRRRNQIPVSDCETDSGRVRVEVKDTTVQIQRRTVFLVE